MTNRPPRLRHRLFRLIFILLIIVGLPLWLVVGCQSKLIYFPRPYAPGVTAQWSASTKGKPVDFTTSQGRQRAFLQGNLSQPKNLWIVCGGNGTVALDWSSWLEIHGPREDAWLLVDFPGYGDCEGSPNPERIRKSLKTVVPLAYKELGWTSKTNSRRLRFFGHSLGGAACLIAASEFRIQRGVLLAPFTSTMEMAQRVTGLPLGFLVTHRFDNQARLREIAAHGPGKIIVFHGTDDEVIPLSMSRELANEQKSLVHLHELPGVRHNTIHQTNANDIAKALESIGAHSD
jgi:pimeloyl-ACP methyl ester carboxylesterase